MAPRLIKKSGGPFIKRGGNVLLLEYPFSLDPFLWHESPDSMNSISSDRRLEINHDPIRGTHEVNLWLSKRALLPPSIPTRLLLKDSRASALSLLLTGSTQCGSGGGRRSC